MKILVTGGAGFVGSHAAKAAVEAGHVVTVLDSLELGHRAAVHPSAKFLQADLTDLSATVRAIESASPDVIMHFAAYSLVGESVVAPEKYYRNNVGGTANLLTAARRLSVGRFIFSSTAATYGNPTGPLTEKHPTAPINPYGRSKLASEQMLQDCAFSSNMRVLVFRYFNVAGAAPDGSIGEDHNPETHLIPNVLEAALGNGNRMKVFGNDYNTGDGTCVRDYIHASDLARAHVMGAEYLAQVNPNHGQGFFDVMNIGTGTGNSVMEVIKAVEEVTGSNVPLDIVGRRAGDPPELVAVADKIRSELGWEPEFPDIRSSVKHAYEWALTHPRGYDDKQ